MTRAELIAKLAATHKHLFAKDAARVVSTIFDEISAALAAGERVELRGFGVFSLHVRKARSACNPKTGEKVHISEKAVPFFTAGKELNNRINKA